MLKEVTLGLLVMMSKILVMGLLLQLLELIQCVFSQKILDGVSSIYLKEVKLPKLFEQVYSICRV